mmetsp:Transcript_26548/g.37408  ORF Transcript_26548/g.37408 Transcript_26548/m.37408 type:complete len:174 (+) Transcript_26548:118-639(+)
MENASSTTHHGVGSCDNNTNSPKERRASLEFKSLSCMTPEESDAASCNSDGGMGSPVGSSLDLEEMLKGLSLHEEKRPSPMNGSWQTDNDLPDRRKMVFKVAAVLLKLMRKKDELPEYLPRMATSFEAHLFVTATTKAEYLNDKTLKRRVSSIVRTLKQLNATKSSLAASSSC